MIRFFRWVLVALLAWPMMLVAQEGAEKRVIQNGQKFGPWTVNCLAIAVGETNCTLIQRMTRQQDGAFVADLTAARDGEGNTILVARVPIGAHLPSGFAMRAAADSDGADVLRFIWQSCTPQFCETAVRISPEKAETMSAEDSAMIAAFRPTPQSDPLVFRMSLNGMAEGLDAIRP